MAAKRQGEVHASSAPEVITFDDPDKRVREKMQRMKAKKKEIASASAKSRLENSGNATTKKVPLTVKLRKTDYHDMLRYGISNLKGEERKQARMRLAIELGAQIPKKGTGNFKNFLAQQKQEKEEKRKNAEENHAIQQAIQKSKINQSKGGAKKKFSRNKKRGKNEVSGSFDGQIGSYKRGVQVVSKKDFSFGGSSRNGPSNHKKRSK